MPAAGPHNQAAEAAAARKSIDELRLRVQFGSINGCARMVRRSLVAIRYAAVEFSVRRVGRL
jgi:hypothetical protein